MEWSGVAWSGVEWSGVEWSGVECDYMVVTGGRAGTPRPNRCTSAATQACATQAREVCSGRVEELDSPAACCVPVHRD